LIFTSAINLDKLIFGTSLPENNPLGRADPRTKILAILALIISITVTLNAFIYIIISLILIAGVIIAGIPLRHLAVNFRPVFLIAVITFLLHLIFSSHGGKAIISSGSFAITDTGFLAGIKFAWRIFLFFAVASLFNLTTSPVDVSDALVRLLKPLKWLKIPVNHLGLLIFMAFRFIPLLFEESRAIYAAQVSRGFNPKGGMIKRFRNAVPLMTAIFMASIRRADNMALALEARGFYPGRERTSYRQFRLKAGDISILALSILVLILSIASVIYA